VKALRDAKAYVRLHKHGVPPKGDPRELLAALVEAVEAAPVATCRRVEVHAGHQQETVHYDFKRQHKGSSGNGLGQRVRVLAVGEDG
jgi:hypothetical protein